VQGTAYGTYPPNGATWLTYDGTNSWSNPGGDFDPVVRWSVSKNLSSIRMRTTGFSVGTSPLCSKIRQAGRNCKTMGRS